MDNELTSSSSENIRVSLSHRRRRQAIATPSATRSATLEARAATSAGGKGDDIGSDGGGDALVAEVALDAGLGKLHARAETETVVPSRTLNSDLGTHAFISQYVTRTTSKFCAFGRTARSCPLSPRPRWRSTCCCASVRAARRSSPSSCASPTTCRPSLRWATRPSRSCTLTC